MGQNVIWLVEIQQLLDIEASINLNANLQSFKKMSVWFVSKHKSTCAKQDRALILLIPFLYKPKANIPRNECDSSLENLS